MTTNLDNLVRRQAAILAEIGGLDRGELESFANSPLPEDATSLDIRKARKLLRGLLRNGNVGNGDLKINRPGIDNPGIVTSPPGYFVVDLLPLPEGGFHPKQAMKIPLVAWNIDSAGYATPVVPCSPMTDRWAVLTPTGHVIADEHTMLHFASPIELKNWIKDESEWVELPRNELDDLWYYWTASQQTFECSGPLPRAIWFMMDGCGVWTAHPRRC